MSNSTTSWQGVLILPSRYAENFQKITLKIKEVEIEVGVVS